MIARASAAPDVNYLLLKDPFILKMGEYLELKRERHEPHEKVTTSSCDSSIVQTQAHGGVQLNPTSNAY